MLAKCRKLRLGGVCRRWLDQQRPAFFLSVDRALFQSHFSLPLDSVRFSSTAPEFARPLEEATREKQLANDVTLFLQDAQRAASWNQGQGGKWYDKTCWDYEFCRTVVARYDAYLDAILQQDISQRDEKRLLQPPTVHWVLKALLKSHFQPPQLARHVRQWERTWGQLQQTPLTDKLSLRLLEANAKAGNVGRVLALLQLRLDRNYPPQPLEFQWAVCSLQASTWTRGRSRRNPFVSEQQLQLVQEDPTRWLDAILWNMHQRQYALKVDLAAQMLTCFASGPTGKAVHHFYRIMRQPTAAMPLEERPLHTQGMPQEWMHVPPEYQDDDDDDDAMNEEDQEDDQEDTISDAKHTSKGTFLYQPIKVQLRYHRAAPPFYKIPTHVQGKLLASPEKPKQFKLQRECEPEYSYPLAAAFNFANSIQQGACGHAPIQLNVACYNALIKASVHRGALWRAMHVLDQVMVDCCPNTVSYNHILTGLARVGDVVMAQDYYMKMLAQGLSPDAFTVRAIVDGLLNVGDLSSAVTVVQDFFNQHCVLPPYTTHLKVLEFCLAHDMIHEAKRYVAFLQQIWNWQPTAYHSRRFIKLVKATQQNEQLQRPALEQLFAYFGEELTDKDFY